VVLGGPFATLRGLSAACRARGVPCVYNTEYSLTTRVQIVQSSVKNPLRKLRKFVWEVTEEYWHLRNELRLADGVQCNGTPTFEAYKQLTPSPLLYFDNRVTADEVVSDVDLARANQRRCAGGQLRLAFSGRLNAMKGAGDLVSLAAALRDRGVAFQLDIFGSGPLEEQLRQRTAQQGLAGMVKLEGVLDFHGELLPRLRETVDLFVCCHVQGDPSCTYLETMSAGVPIVGYSNEAFAGLCAQAPIGWATPLRDVDALADEIARLADARAELARHAEAAVAFAREHAFERTFRRRVAHLREVAERARHGRRATVAA
jgi:colanic acid/amylovoran biosynthesis glycosyltransferase